MDQTVKQSVKELVSSLWRVVAILSGMVLLVLAMYVASKGDYAQATFMLTLVIAGEVSTMALKSDRN